MRRCWPGTDHETTKTAPPYNVAANVATGYQGALDAFNAARNECGSCDTNFGGESEGSNDVSRGRNCQVCEGYCHISRSIAWQLHNQGSCGAGTPNT